MNAKTRTLLWLAPLCVLACIGCSLAAVWGLGILTGLKLDAPVVAALSGGICAASIAVSRRCRGSGEEGRAA
jgi:hypothetical protein